jgi:hypothetical protein
MWGYYERIGMEKQSRGREAMRGIGRWLEVNGEAIR